MESNYRTLEFTINNAINALSSRDFSKSLKSEVEVEHLLDKNVDKSKYNSAGL